jgi:hypothetical protein
MAALLAIWNAVTPEHETAFNHWYDTEHVPERLALPGFLSATRYRDASRPHYYCALYEAPSIAALSSPEYLARLADPTPATTAIMAQFRDMNRAVCEVAIDTGALPAPGGTLLIVQLDESQAAKINTGAAAALASAGALRIRLARPDAARTQVDTPEKKLRSEPDRLPPTLLLIEGNDPAACASAAQQLATGQQALGFSLLYQRRQA